MDLRVSEADGSGATQRSQADAESRSSALALLDVDTWPEAREQQRALRSERRPRVSAQRRLVVVSNRLPTSADNRPHAGGLVSALLPALEERGGLWCGWSGSAVTEPAIHERETGKIQFLALDLDRDAVAGYYQGYSNCTLWPRMHGMESRSRFSEADYRMYREVNRRFASVLIGRLRSDDVVWVHDYHLIPLGEELRMLGWRGPVGYFHHLPIPDRDTWQRIPHAAELAAALMHYSHIGVQTPEDTQHLAAILDAGLPPPIEAHPARIDSHGFRELASNTPLTLDEDAIAERTVLFGVDRLDYTKGIALRLQAWERVLQRRPDLRDSAVFVQWAAPSREEIDEYREERAAIEAVALRIQQRYGRARSPLLLDISDHPRSEVAAALRRADVGVVTSVADGMNLVAKEFAAVHDATHPGTLVLSHGCGAAASLSNAVLVQGNSVASIAGGIERALDMTAEERKRQARALRSTVDAESRADWASKIAKRIEAARSGLWDASPVRRGAYLPTRFPTREAAAPGRLRLAMAAEVEADLEERLQDWACEQLVAPLPVEAMARGSATVHHVATQDAAGADWLSQHGAELRTFALEAKDAGYTRVLVVGTGDSIATAALFAARSHEEPCGLRVDVVDAATPEAMVRIHAELGSERRLVVVASRSGRRETLGLFRYLWSRNPAGEHYVAVTDRGSQLDRLAVERGFRRRFLSDARDAAAPCSAFSYAGMLPAALAGVDLDLLTAHAQSMTSVTREPRASENAAVHIALLLEHVAERRGAVSIRVDEQLRGLDVWMGQLLARSDGQYAAMSLPLTDLPAFPSYTAADAFILLGPRRLDRTLRALEAAEHSIVHCPVPDWHAVGGMFVLWEAVLALVSRLRVRTVGVPGSLALAT